jgi:CRISPR-associated endonuclease/helicase Cas3
MNSSFDHLFRCLVGQAPFPWQQLLYERFISGDLPDSCTLPTGLGKTAVVPIWLLALAAKPASVPRRLVYVVNRRTVVDQATDEAKKLRDRMDDPNLKFLREQLTSLCALPCDTPLAISTLRGQFADNAEWRLDPARPAVIVGTVDMIGSRLLFSGYRCGFKSKPLHAGFLGHDVLLVHDEAHLEPAFQQLLLAVEREIGRERERFSAAKPFKVMELSATSRAGASGFALSDADREDDIVKKRLNASKHITLHSLEDAKKLAERLAELALAYEESRQAILVFARTVEDVQKVAERLRRAGQSVATLTGTMRGYERDAFATEDRRFARFLPEPKVEPEPGTVYLICTSAGEVGVNISADHLVSDLTPLDSMTQRFGRVNRFGEGKAEITVVHPTNFDGKGRLDNSCEATLALLKRLEEDASPGALSDLFRRLSPDELEKAFTPKPVILPVDGILFDAWALTTIEGDLPGRPAVADYLHGVDEEREPPQTEVAWREEVARLNDDQLLEKYPPKEILEAYPLKPHELLRDSTKRVFEQLEKMAKRLMPSAEILLTWVVDPKGAVECLSLAELVKKDKQKKPVVDLAGCTIILPPSVGGLAGGLLQGEAPFEQDQRYDVADLWRDEDGQPRRFRLWDDNELPQTLSPARLAITIDIRPPSLDEIIDDPASGLEASSSRRYWHWYVRVWSADDDGSGAATEPVPLNDHLQDVERAVTSIADALKLPPDIRAALIAAARNHDLGKARELWQRSIGNWDGALLLAKSGHSRRPDFKTSYRHEFGSLVELCRAREQLCPNGIADLALHLVAAHHGRARPHYPREETFDPKADERSCIETGKDVPQRFALLQQQYGRWGLAYLESLLRAADAFASAKPTKRDSE